MSLSVIQKLLVQIKIEQEKGNLLKAKELDKKLAKIQRPRSSED